jgi:hypothetical protein
MDLDNPVQWTILRYAVKTQGDHYGCSNRQKQIHLSMYPDIYQNYLSEARYPPKLIFQTDSSGFG